MKFFEKCTTIEELKKEYKKLAFKHHPDRGGDIEVMKMVNNDYEKAFNTLKKMQNKDSKQENTNENANDYITIINALINDDVTIQMIGSWLWVSGNTYPIREKLKELGLLYSRGRKMWFFSNEVGDDDTRKKYKGKKQELSTIIGKYGCSTIKENKGKKNTFKPKLT